MDYEIARLSLARLGLSPSESLETALLGLARISASTLRVARVSVWTFSEHADELRCQLSFDKGPPSAAWPTLRSADIPSYVAAIREKRVVCADDARTHPATRELRDGYLVPLGISSMLDAPVYQDGVVMGVVCHEHVGTLRSWTAAEQDFAASVADVVAVLLEQARRLSVETALRARDEELRGALKLEALGQLAVSVAHDFTSVLSAVRLLARKLPEESLRPERLAALAREIEDATSHGVRLSQQLLAFGRASQGSPRAVGLSELVARQAPMLESRARGRGHFVVELLAERDSISADPFQIEQLLLNLVTNALDALPAGGAGTVWVTVREPTASESAGPSSFCPGASVLLEVRDDGAGMTDETRARAFDPYFTTKPQGTGLGLAIVYGTVKQLGGTLHLESSPGAGSRLSIALPLTPVEPKP